MPLRNWRTVLLWILGSISIFFATMIAGKLDFSLGVNEIGFLLAVAVTMLLFLIGGLLWITVALAVRTSRR